MTVGYSTLVENQVGIAQTAFGVCTSLGNNNLSNNGTDTTGILSTEPLM